MKLALVISSLAGGGAERVMAQLASEWARRGDTVTLITLEPLTDDMYAVDSRIRLVCLGLSSDSSNLVQAVRSNFRRITALRGAIAAAAPEVVLSFEDRTNVIVVLATARMQVRRVIAERTDPRRHRIGALWSLLRRLTYPFADVLAVQSNALLQWGRGIMPRASAVEVVPNPVRPMAPFLRRREASGVPTIVAAGRLVPSKGFDLLMTAFASLADEFPAWKLVILGEGDERGRLEELGRQLRIADRLTLAGWHREPGEILRTADLFVLSSHYEGFPNVLLEAMACGLPVVATDCCGVADVVTHEKDGLIVPVGETAQLAAAMKRMMQDADLRGSLGRSALAICERYDLGTVMEQWNRLLAVQCNSAPILRSSS